MCLNAKKKYYTAFPLDLTLAMAVNCVGCCCEKGNTSWLERVHDAVGEDCSHRVVACREQSRCRVQWRYVFEEVLYHLQGKYTCYTNCLTYYFVYPAYQSIGIFTLVATAARKNISIQIIIDICHISMEHSRYRQQLHIITTKSYWLVKKYPRQLDETAANKKCYL